MHGRIVVALGGNAILRSGQRGTFTEQESNVAKTADQIVQMISAGYEVVVTHGNGPQVGAAMIRHATAASIVPAMPMDCCGAETQGFIGYMLSQSIGNLLAARGIPGHDPVCLITRAEVSASDDAFRHPTKPVGPFYSGDIALARTKTMGERWMEDAGRGWRRVVPSPSPVRILESDAINRLADAGFLVIASGGGGIPVVKDENGFYRGVEAVIDKDFAGSRLAYDVGADVFMILTDVPCAAVDYNTERQKWIGNISARELGKLLSEGHFGIGSMKPKVEAALRFVESGGRKSIITNFNNAVAALDGKAGTVVFS